MQALFWIIAIGAVCYAFWRFLRNAAGLAAAVDPDRPLFESATRPTHTIFARLEGVTDTNADGTDRQDVIGSCILGERLRLEREHPAGDEEARVRISRQDGDVIGYLPASAAADVANALHRGQRAEGAIAEITRQARFRRGRGVVAKITMERPGPARHGDTASRRASP